MMLRWRGNLSELWLLPKTGREETMAQGCRRFSGEEGQALVEFALISAAFFSLLLGIFEMSLGLYTYHYISEVAREATRYAVVRGSACVGMPDCNASAAQIQTFVKDLGYPGIDATDYMTVTTTWLSPSSGSNPTWTTCTSCNTPGNMVQVTVNYALPLAIPFWGNKSINISSTSQMVISQ